MFQDIKKIETIDNVEAFLLKHGENIVDMLGGEIDRIELKLRVISLININELFNFAFITQTLRGYLLVFTKDKLPLYHAQISKW